MKQLDLQAPIQPGRGAAGILIGDPCEDLPIPIARKPLSGGERLDYGSVSVWIRNGAVDQIGVREGYRGTLAGAIGVGSSIAEIEEVIGPVIEDDEDNLIVAVSPGWCFATDTWDGGPRVEDNRHARVTEIFVYSTGPGEEAA